MRYVLIDRLTELVPGQRATAEKTFPASEPLFEDHFPGFPVVPGALLTEAMGQTAGWLIAASLEFQAWPLLSMIQSAKFRKFAAPDELLRIEATVESQQSTAWLARTTVTSSQGRVADAMLSFQLFPLTMPGDGRDAFRAWTEETFARLGKLGEP
jgi:3-hydroxyacyl-[acyl-carrier-protein] dehydratase